MSSQLQDALGMFAFLAIELSVLFIGISLLVDSGAPLPLKAQLLMLIDDVTSEARSSNL